MSEMNEDNIYALMEKNLGRNFNREEFDKLMYDYFCHEKITEKIDATICAVDKMSGDIDINVVELAEALSIQYLELEERIDALKKERMIPYWALPLNDKVDFRKTLKRMLKKVTLDSDIKSFDMFLETNINEPFCQGWYSLKPELDISVKEDRAMILLVSGLLEMGLSPINTDAVADGYRIPLNSLVKKELAIMATKESNVFDSSESERLVMLSPRVCGILFRGDPEICSSVSMGHLGSYINNANIKEKKLYFSPSIDEQLSVVKRTFQVESFIAIAERLKKRNRPAGITCLFHGEPGTGKTELAMQIARETGRSIISIDTARITGCYMGESEKAVRQVFLYYRYLLELENVPPILLMNECDGIIGKRTETSRNAAERSDNMVQTIFLDELERFEGLLIATTNLPEGLDKAYDRRFLIKVRFDDTPLEIRKRIWHDEMPSLTADEIDSLSERYRLSGGSIANVVTQCDLFEVLEGRPVPFAKVLDFCEKEVSFRDKGTKPSYQVPVTGGGKGSYS